MHEQLIARIDARLDEMGLSERKACLRAALKVDAIRNIRRGHAPRASTLRALAKALDVAASHFLEVTEEIADDEAIEADDLPIGHVAVPRLTATPGMGGGAFADDDLMGPPEWLPESLVRGELRGQPLDFMLMEVEGQSMQPLLESGDRILIDRRKNNPSQPGIFVLWDGDGLVAKWVERVHRSNPPAFRVTSENSRFTPYEVLAEEARIIGRVVWFARRM